MRAIILLATVWAFVSALPDIPGLPDPFKFDNGTRLEYLSQWAARAAELSAFAQKYEFGEVPPTPADITGAFSSNSIQVTVKEGGKSITFKASITYPTTGKGPFPAMIGVGGSALDNTELHKLGVATITFNNNDIAEQTDKNSRGKGKFFTIYGKTHGAGALAAWAWGVNCLIAALEKTPAANIDASRLGATGCSRNGKGALAVGVFCPKIKLAIPQESGSGGAASWRVSDWQMATGTKVQTLSEIVDENVWFRESFKDFSNTATQLPFDHHSVAAIMAPRGLLFIENTEMVWLGAESTWAVGNTAQIIYEGLKAKDAFGFSQVGHSNHCGFQKSQQPEVTAFVKRFLLGDTTVQTGILKTDGKYTFDKAKWIDWTVPDLQ